MSTARTKVFMSNRSQAVRLPKSVALPEGVKDVVIVAIDSMSAKFSSGRDDFSQAYTSSPQLTVEMQS